MKKLNDYFNELFELEEDEKLQGADTIKLIALAAVVTAVVFTIGYLSV